MHGGYSCGTSGVAVGGRVRFSIADVGVEGFVCFNTVISVFVSVSSFVVSYIAFCLGLRTPLSVLYFTTPPLEAYWIVRHPIIFAVKPGPFGPHSDKVWLR